LKGFGFIVLDDTSEDVFVHQSELKMAGFRSLEEGERVAFYVRSRNNGLREGALEAWQVVHLSFCAVFTAFLLLFVLVAIVVKT
uniref:CSD_1 domain-containing protein n=1 Tax=Heligmosomoides polygyrus TaxID=6339 RepID=A0A183GJ45_HELPZ